jgi:hypothetical protein
MTILRSALASILLLAVLLHAASSAAVSIVVGREGGTSWELTDPNVATSTTSLPDENGVVTWTLTESFVKTAYQITAMTVELKEDPFVTNNITLTNLMTTTQTFTVIVSLPIPAFAYNATIASSIGVTVTDNIGGSVTAAAVALDSIYTGTVNSSGVLTLMTDPFSVACATAGCSNTASDNSAVPQLPATPGVATSIGIALRFTLTAFDSVAITSRFEIINVPEPGVLALLALGLPLALFSRRPR